MVARELMEKIKVGFMCHPRWCTLCGTYSIVPISRAGCSPLPFLSSRRQVSCILCNWTTWPCAFFVRFRYHKGLSLPHGTFFLFVRPCIIETKTRSGRRDKRLKAAYPPGHQSTCCLLLDYCSFSRYFFGLDKTNTAYPLFQKREGPGVFSTSRDRKVCPVFSGIGTKLN